MMNHIIAIGREFGSGGRYFPGVTDYFEKA